MALNQMSTKLGIGMKKFLALPVDKIYDNSITDFNLYYESDEGPILYSTDGYTWYKDELERLLAYGCHKLLTEVSNKPKVRMYYNVNKIEQIKSSEEPAKRILSIQDIGGNFTRALHEGELTESCVKKAQVIAEGLTETLLESSESLKALKSLLDKDQYVYLHSVRVASFALGVAIKLGITDETQLQKIAFGGLLHDIGKSDVPKEILNKEGVLTDDEWKFMKAHPQLGHDKFAEFRIDNVVREIVLHHHEKLDGSGYPHGLNKMQLLPEVQIATLADIYDALTSNRSYQRARTRFEALDFIKKKMTPGHIDSEIFNALIHCLK